jgi:spore germination cell wall hydrolase CwlJ-like protein
MPSSETIRFIRGVVLALLVICGVAWTLGNFRGCWTVQAAAPRPVAHDINLPMDHPPLKTTKKAAWLCLAEAIYFEAGGEPWDTKAAVAATVWTRARMKEYPHSLCGVVYEPDQFSWTADPNRQIATNSTVWKDIVHMAKTWTDPSMGDWLRVRYDFPTNFHDLSVRPTWAHQLRSPRLIGQLMFYSRPEAH